jgi:predicted protein tyrosine phosphatase
MKVLFVCTQNRMRSPTAEALYRGRPDLEVRSAGIAPDARVPVTEEALQWAETTFVMDESHRLHLQTHFSSIWSSTRRIVCLDVPDVYLYMDPELVFILTAKLQPHLGDPALKRMSAPRRPAHRPPPRCSS